MNLSLTFDAIDEATPGPKWASRWARSWPAYKAWFLAQGGDDGPARAECEAALTRHMPELAPVHRKLTRLAGGSDRAARFLSTWCPPAYLGGCSLAAIARDGDVRLVRNYDLSPDLNEGLLLRSAWTDRPGVGPVMGMVEFLWGVSDGINGAGLSVALAYGGRNAVAPGFGITTILRYVLETCTRVEQAVAVLERVPSHMPYNIVLADADGATASVEVYAGGGARVRPSAIATNHQHDRSRPDRADFTRTHIRQSRLAQLLQDDTRPGDMTGKFLTHPLYQTGHAAGFGTLFTAEYDPKDMTLTLHWPGQVWRHALGDFSEGQRVIQYGSDAATGSDPYSSAWNNEAGQSSAIRIFQALGQAGRSRSDDSSMPDPAPRDTGQVLWSDIDWINIAWARVDWTEFGGAWTESAHRQAAEPQHASAEHH